MRFLRLYFHQATDVVGCWPPCTEGLCLISQQTGAPSQWSCPSPARPWQRQKPTYRDAAIQSLFQQDTGREMVFASGGSGSLEEPRRRFELVAIASTNPLPA